MIISIVGAESTGKTSLANALALRWQSATGLSCVAVAEWLRTWCDEEGRTPRPDEQAGIARHQAELVQRAASTCDVVIADTTPLMTAVYSDLLFDDRSLYPFALAFHRELCAATLLTSLDIPWVADGLQRDGPHVRLPVDTLIRSALGSENVTWSIIGGLGRARVEAAFDAMALLFDRLSRSGHLTVALPK